MRALVLLVALIPGCALPDYDYDGDGQSAAAGDCDDFDPTIREGAEELVDDGIDQDCDDADTVARAQGIEHVCDLTEDGRISCVASAPATHGQLEVPAPRPDAIYIDIAAGDFHTCALDDDGFVVCWGDDSFGQSSPPEPINGLIVGIHAFDNVSLGEREDGPAVCWGDCISAKRF